MWESIVLTVQELKIYKLFVGFEVLMAVSTKTSEKLVNFYQTIRRYNPEDSHLRNS
jgi:hypothetical protein